MQCDSAATALIYSHHRTDFPFQGSRLQPDRWGPFFFFLAHARGRVVASCVHAAARAFTYLHSSAPAARVRGSASSEQARVGAFPLSVVIPETMHYDFPGLCFHLLRHCALSFFLHSMHSAYIALIFCLTFRVPRSSKCTGPPFLWHAYWSTLGAGTS